MKTRRVLITFLLAAFAAPLWANLPESRGHKGTEPRDNKGTDFILAFPPNVIPPPQVSHRLTLFLAADEAARVEISGPEIFTTLFDVPSSSVLEVFFDTTSIQLPDGKSKKGIRVRSIDPVDPRLEGPPIAVFGLNRRVTSAGAFLALPVEVLGTQYRALTQSGTASAPGSQVTIVGTRNDTVVRITTPVDVPGVTTARVPYELVLNRLEAFLLQLPAGDLTGTLVAATEPVAVFSGSHNSSVNGGSPDHMIEQMVPTSDWGDEFVVAPIATPATRPMGDIVRVLAHEDETEVELNGALKTVLGEGQVYQFTQPTTSGSWIKTSKPTLVGHYNRGDLPLTSPFVMLVPPIREFSGQYLFKTPRFAAPGESHWISIITREGDQAGVLLNGEALPASVMWTPVNGYSYARVMIPAGTVQRLEHRQPEFLFGAWVYGHANGEGYGFSAGQLVEDRTRPVITSPDDQMIEATGPDGATATWTAPTATDFGRGEIAVKCTAESGAVFALGETEVDCSATDPAGNTTTDSFTITVRDTTPPTLSVSGTSVHARSRAGAIVRYTATATDAVSKVVTVVCSPPSGSRFPIGTDGLTLETPAQCTATDDSHNEATTYFMVAVTNSAPVCSAATPSMPVIPSQFRGFAPILVQGVTDADGDPIRIRILSIFQDEPVVEDAGDDTGAGGNPRRGEFDGYGVGTSMAYLRAQRSRDGDGRVYHIRFRATDHIGASCSGEVTVAVPRRRDGTAVDGGALFDSTAGYRRRNEARGRARDGVEQDDN